MFSTGLFNFTINNRKFSFLFSRLDWGQRRPRRTRTTMWSAGLATNSIFSALLFGEKKDCTFLHWSLGVNWQQKRINLLTRLVGAQSTLPASFERPHPRDVYGDYGDSRHVSSWSLVTVSWSTIRPTWPWTQNICLSYSRTNLPQKENLWPKTPFTMVRSVTSPLSRVNGPLLRVTGRSGA